MCYKTVEDEENLSEDGLCDACINKHYGRREDPTVISCGGCGWIGRVMDTIHAYRPDNMDDVEPVDKCPNCKRELD